MTILQESTQPRSHLTPEQYLEIERKAEYKSEYLAGQVFAMSRASEEHNLIAVNLIALLRPQLRTRGCRLYTSDMRVRIMPTGLFTYADVVAVCDKPRFMDSHVDTLLNPTFLVEILSPSTEAYDRGRKSEHYRALESLTEYLLLAQDHMHADLFTRAEGRWVLTEAGGPEDVLDLHSIGCKIKMADLYEDIVLPS